jgi:putative OPT family oligopeptide transporter
MPIKHLTDEQVRSMRLEEKDRWWLENVFKGDMPQLTARSAVTGMGLGAILSLTNLYIGMMTGWTLGVGVTSVILSFAMFKALSRMNLGTEMTLLENNAMQSIATSAGYMTAPLVSSISAYMLVTQRVLPPYQTMAWVIALALLGVLIAFPLKRRFINDEQMPFPEGRAAGIVMDDLHSGEARDASFKAKLLASSAGVSALIELVRDEGLMSFLGLKFLSLPEYWDSIIYKFWVPKILGTPLRDLTISLESSIVMVAAGGLMGVRTGLSLLVGAFLNYAVLAPIMIDRGIIEGTGFKNITMWSLWGGVAMMTTASLFAFFSKPRMVLGALGHIFGSRDKNEDVLKDIELPIWVFLAGIPVLGVATVLLGHHFFGIHYVLGLIGIPLAFVFTVIAVNSTGLTSITPVGALGKLTQLTYSVLAPGNITTNIMTAGITGEAASNASNLLMDIKPGYMLGGKPRHQAMGHVLGIFAGAFAAIPVFYLLFHGDLSVLTSEKFPMPAAQVWAAVATVLTRGLGFLHPTAQWAILAGGAVGIIFELAKMKMGERFPLSGVAIGLAFVIPFSTSLAMALGASVFWLLGNVMTDERTGRHRIFVDNQETLCAGAIAGGAMVGILLVISNEMLFP